MPSILALAGGGFIVVAVCAVVVLGVIIGWYTRAGSEISAHPSGGQDDAPRSADPSTRGSGETETSFGTQGTR